MRIAIDIRKIGKKSTGDETYTRNLVLELAKTEKAKKHFFVLLTDDEENKIKKILPRLPKNFSIKKVSPVSKIFWTFFSLPRFLKKNPVDVLHVQYVAPFFLSRKIKILTTIHDISFKINPGWISPKDSLLLNRFIPPTLKRADRIITVSEFSKDQIAKKFEIPPEKIMVTSPAVSDKMALKMKKSEARRKVETKYHFRGKYFLHISSLQPRKNVPAILKAFDRLERDSSEKLKLVIAGKRNGHNYDKRIDESMAEMKNSKDVIFVDYVEEKWLAYLYRGAEGFVFPSSYEGFGLPVLESLINQTPVIGTRIGSTKEVGGEAVFYVNGKKGESCLVEEIKKKMETIMQDPLKVKRKKTLGLLKVKKYSWERMARETLKIYETV